LIWISGLALAGAVCAALLVGYVCIIMNPQLPSVAVLGEFQPVVPLRVFTADNVLIGEYGVERRIPLTYEQIPDIVKQAVVATEDARFYEHHGVDFKGLARAALADVVRGEKGQGASTITMQLARNFFLSRDKTYLRKVYEILLAIRIESELSKPQILQLYINQVFLGERAYGFGAAAKVYFGKDLADISVAQAALLAGLPKAPSAFNPMVNPTRARARQTYILSRMHELGYLDDDRYRAALAEAPYSPPLPTFGPKFAQDAGESVRKTMFERYGEAAYERGFQVWTTIRSTDQKLADEAVRHGIAGYEQRHRGVGLGLVQGALVSLSPRDGAVRALVGGNGLGSFNHVTQAWRQPGSTFKPFIYSAALEKGLGPATVIDDAPFERIGDDHRVWRPREVGQMLGPITMREALTKSKNLVSVRILDAIGPDYAKSFAVERFGFGADKLVANLPMALGAGSVTPLQMARAYAVFANGGYLIDPYLIARIVDGHAETVFEARPALAGSTAPRVLSEANSYIMNSLLQSVAQHGTASAINVLQRPDLGAKTGTTNDARDGWFAGYQHELVAVAWMGFDTPRTLGAHEWGARTALPIWLDYMRGALAGVPIYRNDQPADVVLVGGEMYEAAHAPETGFIPSLDADAVGRDGLPASAPATVLDVAIPGVSGEKPTEPASASEKRQILQYFDEQ
jgi:penicillin-binding protein 1A